MLDFINEKFDLKMKKLYGKIFQKLIILNTKIYIFLFKKIKIYSFYFRI